MKEKASHPISFLVTDDLSYTLYSKQFKATYHSIRGAVSESDYVFIKNGLGNYNERFKPHKVAILEIGFGTGLNTFLTQLYALEHGMKINFHTVEAYPIRVEDALKLNYGTRFASVDELLLHQLHEQAWDTSMLYSDSFSLTKHFSLLESFTSQLTFDVIYFDTFSPSEQPELWTEEVFKKLFELLNSNGILVTYCAQGQMKRNMKAAGFKVESLPGALGKREMTRGLKGLHFFNY